MIYFFEELVKPKVADLGNVQNNISVFYSLNFLVCFFFGIEKYMYIRDRDNTLNVGPFS